MVRNEWLLANEISVFFNYQYFINRLIFVMQIAMNERNKFY